MDIYNAGQIYADYINRKSNYRLDAVQILAKSLNLKSFYVLLSKDYDTDYLFVMANMYPINIKKYKESLPDDEYIPSTVEYLVIHETVHDIEYDEYTKEKLWTMPDYEKELLQNEDKELLYWKKSCRDMIPAYSLSQSGQQNYFEFVTSFRDAVESVKTFNNIFNVNQWMISNGYLCVNDGLHNDINNNKYLLNQSFLDYTVTNKLDGTGIESMNIPTTREELKFAAAMEHFAGLTPDVELLSIMKDCAKQSPELFKSDILSDTPNTYQIKPIIEKGKSNTIKATETDINVDKEIFKQKKSSMHM